MTGDTIKVEIYTSEYCAYCRAAKALLDRKGLEYSEIDLTGNHELRIEISQKHNWRTVPVIYINNEFVGGFDQLMEMERSGKLDELTA